MDEVNPERGCRFRQGNRGPKLGDVGVEVGLDIAKVVLFKPVVNQRLDNRLWLPPLGRLWQRPLMRQSSELKLLSCEVEMPRRNLYNLSVSRTTLKTRRTLTCILYGLTSSAAGDPTTASAILCLQYYTPTKLPRYYSHRYVSKLKNNIYLLSFTPQDRLSNERQNDRTKTKQKIVGTRKNEVCSKKGRRVIGYYKRMNHTTTTTTLHTCIPPHTL